MATLADKVRVEMDNISRVLSELKNISAKPDKSVAELAGIGTFLHNFYSGVENILKQIFADRKIEIPSSASWHKDLLERAVQNGVLSADTRTTLGKFLFFRHFFVHSYGFMIEEDEINPLMHLAPEAFESFQREIHAYLDQPESAQGTKATSSD